VLVVGSSIGGWIALEAALQDAAAGGTPVISQLILVNSVGVDVPGEPIRNLTGLGPRELAEFAWADPSRGFIDPSTLPAERLAVMQGNAAALQAYAGDPYMHDPSLLVRLGSVAASALVVWGEEDRVVTPAYGRAIAGALPDARFELIAAAGHLPHLEQPAATLAVVEGFVRA
jgi:pimeloyl-ACP methyl ester carboxylesterase